MTSFCAHYPILTPGARSTVPAPIGRRPSRQVHQRRLAGAVPAEQPTNPAALHRQIDAPENRLRTARIGDRQGFHRHIVGMVGHHRVLLDRNMNGSIVRRNIAPGLSENVQSAGWVPFKGDEVE